MRFIQRKRTASDRGLTLLEIFLAAFLLFLLTASFLTIRRQKALSEPIQRCVRQQWQWLAMADEVEWRLRRWEILAASCLKAGFVPVATEKTDGFQRIWDVEMAAPVVKPVTVPDNYVVAPGSEFMAGQMVVICSATETRRGTIRHVSLGLGRQLLVEVSPDGNEPPLPAPAGSFVVAVRPVVYESESAESGKIYYERRSATERRRLGEGFDEWSLAANADASNSAVAVRISMRAAGCRLVREFPLLGQESSADLGRWWIREGELFFDPWILTPSEVKP
jgi:hypothetical protein